jgi:uncharacterized protein YlxW (UPF0749 family)
MLPYLRTTAADSTAGKVSDKAKDQTDMMKLMTDMQKRLSYLQRDVNQLNATLQACHVHSLVL